MTLSEKLHEVKCATRVMRKYYKHMSICNRSVFGVTRACQEVFGHNCIQALTQEGFSGPIEFQNEKLTTRVLTI